MTLGARDALDLLGEAALALTFAIAVAWAIRAPLRRYCGASVAYAAWALPPVALLALALPAPTVVVAPATVAAQVALPAAVATAMPVVDRAAWWCALWLCGALAMTAHQWRLQRRFVASLGDLQNVMPGLWRAQGRSGLPALIGLLRPRIVLPADFDTRYDAEERALMLAHERAHLRRGDPWANLVATALRIAFWFHPLVHLAAVRFRDDQELACDQRVIASAPQARRRYGEAMLKTLVAAQPVPLGCHWGLTHPMKERLMHLQASPPRRFARAAGIAIACLAIAGTAFAVWSAQTPTHVPTHVPSRAVAAAPTSPASPTAVGGRALDYVADIRARIDDGESDVFVLGGAYGEPIAFSQQTDDGRIDVEARIRDAGQARYDIVATIERDGRVIASPRLIVERGKPAAVRVGEEKAGAGFEGIALDLVVRPPPPSAGIAPSQPAELSRLPELPQLPKLPDLAELPRMPTTLASASPLELEAPPAPPSPPDPPAAPAAPPAPPEAPEPPEPPELLEAPRPAQPDATVETAAQARREAQAAKQHAEAARQQAVAAKRQAQAGREQAQASKAQAETARRQGQAAKEEAEAAASKRGSGSMKSGAVLPLRMLRSLSAQSTDAC